MAIVLPITTGGDFALRISRGKVIGNIYDEICPELPKAYATLGFAGDELDPGDISAVLPVAPKRAHRKGEIFYAGPRW